MCPASHSTLVVTRGGQRRALRLGRRRYGPAVRSSLLVLGISCHGMSMIVAPGRRSGAVSVGGKTSKETGRRTEWRW